MTVVDIKEHSKGKQGIDKVQKEILTLLEKAQGKIEIDYKLLDILQGLKTKIDSLDALIESTVESRVETLNKKNETLLNDLRDSKERVIELEDNLEESKGKAEEEILTTLQPFFDLAHAQNPKEYDYLWRKLGLSEDLMSRYMKRVG